MLRCAGRRRRQYGPVIRPGRLPAIDDTAPGRGSADRPPRPHASPTRPPRWPPGCASAPPTRPERRRSARRTATLAQDRAWLGAAEKRIKDGTTGARGVAAVDQFVGLFKQIGGLMAERVTDLKDIRDRVIAELSGLPEPGVPLLDVASILCAEDLAPADTAGLDPALVVALATTLGGPTSHTAIIARQLGIPCVVAVDGLTRSPRGPWCWSTAPSARSPCRPTRPPRARRSPRRSARRSWRRTGPARRHRRRACRAILANVQDGAAARSARETPAEGVGLFRTELCFLNRDTEPSVDEQATSTRSARGLRRPQGGGQDARRRFGQAAEVRRHPEEANPALGCGASGSPRATRGCWNVSWKPSPPPPSAPAPAVGDGADDRHRR